MRTTHKNHSFDFSRYFYDYFDLMESGCVIWLGIIVTAEKERSKEGKKS